MVSTTPCARKSTLNARGVSRLGAIGELSRNSPANKYITPGTNDMSPAPKKPLTISIAPMMRPCTPRTFTIPVGTVSAVRSGCLETNTPARIPIRPVRSDHNQGTDRSTKTRTRANTPMMSQYEPTKETSAAVATSGAVRSIKPRTIPTIPWSKKSHQMFVCSGCALRLFGSSWPFDVVVFRPSPPSEQTSARTEPALKLCQPVPQRGAAEFRPGRREDGRSHCIHSDRRKSSTACLSLTDRALKFWITLLASDAAYPPLVATQVSPKRSPLERSASTRVDVEKCAWIA